MEDVLELYQEPYDPSRPVVCMDETNQQLVGETRTPIAAGPGRPRRIDYEYERPSYYACRNYTQYVVSCEVLRQSVIEAAGLGLVQEKGRFTLRNQRAHAPHIAPCGCRNSS